MSIIIPLDIYFNVNEGIEYLKYLDKFPHLRWVFDELSPAEIYQGDRQYNSAFHNITPMYCWTLRSNWEDTWRPKKLDYYFEGYSNEYKNTELVVGLADKLLKMFPTMGSMHIGGHPPGTQLELHRDDDEFFRIHVPLITNDQAYFFGEDKIKHTLSPGRLYILETSKYHGTANDGTSDRIHILFKMPRHLLNDTIKLTGKL
jgi:hypothetical protein